MVAGALWLTGCAAAFIGVPPQELRTTVETAAALPATCPFSIERIEDRRSDRSLGFLDERHVADNGMLDWLSQSIAALPGSAPAPAPRSIRVDLLKAYVYRSGPLVITSLVVQVGFVSSGTTHEVAYSGVDRLSPFVVTDRGLQMAFDRAMTSLVTQIHQGAAVQCAISDGGQAPAGRRPYPA